MEKNKKLWFEKWGFKSDISLLERYELLEEKYKCLLQDVKRLEEENVETSNTLYEIMNSLDAIDQRIDILYNEKNTN